MSFEIQGTFELKVADDGMLPVHAEVLELRPRFAIKTGQSGAKGVTALLILPSLRGPGVVPMTPDLFEHLDAEEAALIVGRSQPPWSREHASLRTPGPLDVPPFALVHIGFNGRAFLPYVPESFHRGAEIGVGLSITGQAAERGSLRGKTLFGGAIFLSDAEGNSEWYQLTGFYEPTDDYAVRTEVRHLAPCLPDERARIYWRAEPDFDGG